MTPPEGARRRFLGVALIAGALVGAAVLSGPVVDRVSGRATVREARAELEAAGMARASSPPKGGPNASATELGRLVEPLGIRLTGRDDRRLKLASKEWLRAQLEQPHEEVAPPPEEVVAELDRLAPTLDAIAAALPSLHDASWGSQLPSLLRAFDLQRLFLAEALLAARRGDDAAAARWTDAAWRVNDLLATRPELVSQLVRLAAARACLAVTMRLDVEPQGIDERLDVDRWRVALADAVAWDAHELLDLAEKDADAIAAETQDDAGLLTILLAPTYRRGMAHAALGQAEIWRELSDATACGPSTRPAPPPPRRSGFSLLASAGFGSELHSVFTRIDALRLHVELTRRVLDLKRARAATGAWPATVPGGEASACPGVRFALTEPGAGIARLEVESWSGPWWIPENGSPGPALGWQSSPPPQPDGS